MIWRPLVMAAAVIALPPLTPEDATRAKEMRKHVFSSRDGLGVDQSRIDALSDEDRELMVTYFHALLDSMRKEPQSESSLRQSHLATNLARFDDPWGIESFAMRYRAQPRAGWADDFKYVRNAKLIAMVGDMLFKEEEYEMPDDLGLLPTQWTAAQGIIQTLKYSAQFRPDIQQWAQQLEEAWSKPGGDVINLLREWYRANEEKLRAGAFKDIRPGRTPKPTVSTAPAAGVPANAPQMPPAPPASIPASVAAAPQSEPKGHLVEIIAAAAVGLLGVLIFLWKRRT